MTQANLNTHIINIQNLYGEFVLNKYLAKLKIGKVCKEAELAMVIVRKYLKYLYTYQTLEEEVTYAYSFNIDRLTEGPVTITINIGLDTFTYIGEGAIDEILEVFQTDILDSSNYNFEVTIIDSVLYVYSYDNTLTFATTTTVSSSEEDYVSIIAVNAQNTYCKILLDNINCLTTEELCGIISHSKKLLLECNCN